jgi:hypothetical protein
MDLSLFGAVNNMGKINNYFSKENLDDTTPVDSPTYDILWLSILIVPLIIWAALFIWFIVLLISKKKTKKITNGQIALYIILAFITPLGPILPIIILYFT